MSKIILISGEIHSKTEYAILKALTENNEIIELKIEDHLGDTWLYPENIGAINIFSDEFEGDNLISTQIWVYPNCEGTEDFTDEGGYKLILVNSDQKELNLYSENYQ